MSERYTRLFALSHNLYSEGAPVIISAGVLLKDNQTGGILAQLKFKSLSNRQIKAVTVALVPQDTAGRLLGDSIVHQYLDLNAVRNSEFGQKVPIALPDLTTRAFSVSLTQVIFVDNSIWKDFKAAWAPLPAQESLSSAFCDAELFAQYQLQFGRNCIYNYHEVKDLWYCPCGEINHISENCIKCKKNGAYYNNVDMEKLKADKDARVAKEQKGAAERAEAERKAAEDKVAANKARATKIKKWIAIVGTVVAVLIATRALVLHVIIPIMNYNAAVALKEAGQYNEAILVFENMRGYKDSGSQIEICKTAILDIQYDEATALMNSKKYEEAQAIFESIQNHKDSGVQIAVCREAIKEREYQNAISLMNDEKYLQAVEQFKKLSNYKDSAILEKESAISLAAFYKESGLIQEAIDWYGSLGNTDKVNEIMYEYVLSHKDVKDAKTCTYLQTLMACNYRDSASIYSSLYKISVNLSIKQIGYNYFASVIISGGPPAGGVSIRILNEGRWIRGNTYEKVTDKAITCENGVESLVDITLLYAFKHRITAFDEKTGKQLAQVFYN